ncbi:MAG: M28 family peptidase, partial [Treponema sp.]|nr:M28 family peptidase [Treponema sp.]
MPPSRTKDPWSDIPYRRFLDFIAPGADRYGILLSLIEQLGLNSAVFPVNGNRHFFIFPPGQKIQSGQGGFPFSGQSPVILAAHYDRVPGSPGANDNSAAVFHLLRTALCLGKRDGGYWIIIFTDKEELAAGEGIRDQGSFTLAEKLRLWGLGSGRVFILDACGTGDTFIISNTTDNLLKNDERPGARRTKQLIQDLRDQALETARQLRLHKVLLVPTPFSDDAGFLRAGIPAQTITMLPAEEAASYAALLRKRPGFAGSLIAGGFPPADRFLVPETWRCVNGPADSHLRLTPEHYNMVIRFAAELCQA